MELRADESPFTGGSAIVFYIAAALTLAQILTARRYGYFRDELYYLACSEHLAAGYVDQPPLIALIAWFERHVFGSGLIALRLLPALAAGGKVLLTGVIARQFGARRWAQVLAALAVVFAPLYLALDHLLTMNAFEPLLWMGCAYVVLRLIRTGNRKLWLWFGVLSGIGLENKWSMAFFGAGIVVGLLFTPERRQLASKWIWIGGAIAFLIWLPNLIWNVQHHWPFFELMHNIRMGNRDPRLNPLMFTLEQAIFMNAVGFLLVLAGVWFFFSAAGRRDRVLGWAFLTVYGLMMVLHGKAYYVAPLYPMMFAAGAVMLERWWSGHSGPRVAYTIALIAVGAALLPQFLPVLPVNDLLAYQQKTGLRPPKIENQNTGPLNQLYADMYGWEEMTRETARVYHSLPPEVQAKTAIYAANYGEAAAIDFFGPKYGLPAAISAHQSYWFWGPRQYTGESIILLGDSLEGDRNKCESVTVAGRVQHPLSRRDEWFDILLCNHLKWNLQTIWPEIKHWD
ncbi:MAG TPA: glycosyltransferase family 39 protein [Terriglobales bacterium]|nr:glycosyltransferase family 39 protein [Terriglobales bacterium]